MNNTLNWTKINSELLEKGFAKIPSLLSETSCNQLINAYQNDIYRSTINMQRYNFGRGEYKYYSYPLPDIIIKLRQYFYQNLRPAAQEWASRLKLDQKHPPSHDDYIKKCKEHNQLRPTPLILQYGPEDYNCLHQDLYGEIHFPYQVAIMLSDQNEYSGGEFTLVAQRPRMQSMPHVISLDKGEAVIFAVNEFPVMGKRGYYRCKLKHGVSKIHTGKRHTLGIILHDGK